MPHYTPGSDLGYALGVAGSLMMLALFLYPLRKRFAALQGLGPVRYWFRAHMALGILGPVLVLAHSQLRVGSANAAVALACMLLVAGSGVVGRFLYRQIHHGLYGSRASLDELQRALEKQRLEGGKLLEAVRGLEVRLAAFEQAAARRGGWRFMTLGWRERRVFEACKRELKLVLRARARTGADRREIVRVYGEAKALVAERLRLARTAAHFQVYERLFSLWHVAHVPFVYLLAASAVIHVVAVHMY